MYRVNVSFTFAFLYIYYSPDLQFILPLYMICVILCYNEPPVRNKDDEKRIK